MPLQSYTNKKSEVKTVNTSSLSLSRHFNKGSFSIYGRIHCEAQGLSKRHRRCLTIDGEETVDLDFRSMSAFLAYACVLGDGSESSMPIGDAYEVEFFSREMAKKAFQICLNSSEREGAQKALRKQYPELVTPSSLISAIERKHTNIKECFYKGVWMSELSMMESNIMMSVLDHCVGYGIPVLPIHDGLVCREQDKDMVVKFMAYCFKLKCHMSPEITMVRDKSGTKEIIRPFESKPVAA